MSFGQALSVEIVVGAGRVSLRQVVWRLTGAAMGKIFVRAGFVLRRVVQLLLGRRHYLVLQAGGMRRNLRQIVMMRVFTFILHNHRVLQVTH